MTLHSTTPLKRCKNARVLDWMYKALIEHPEVHMIAWSDQRLFNEHRQESFCGLGELLLIEQGIPIKDVVCFFLGDGPAQQFEAGPK